VDGNPYTHEDSNTLHNHSIDISTPLNHPIHILRQRFVYNRTIQASLPVHLLVQLLSNKLGDIISIENVPKHSLSNHESLVLNVRKPRLKQIHRLSAQIVTRLLLSPIVRVILIKVS